MHWCSTTAHADTHSKGGRLTTSRNRSTKARSRKSDKRCKDCTAEGITTRRKAPYPGPRCTTHHRANKKQRKEYSHKSHVEETYGITYEQYWAIYKAQGGVCFICKRANGTRRKLSVDHDHSCCSGSTSCSKCVRGLLCSTCNRYVLGHLRDDTTALQRAIWYLANPPAHGVIKR
ncbi:endonuclease VII domain-containing protein [Saccharopolyspora indica]|uniref:endonuclease VII domain-containing protein n=1 Tax=Saccharopolyspora indica TaxID=1229659 RepID=UPI0035660EF9